MKQFEDSNLEVPPESTIFGASEAMRKIRRDLALIASADVPVLIQGPSGTGKEIIARMIHRASAYAQGPYQRISCPATPDALLESELFGYEGEACPAGSSKSGMQAMVERGTLFLDEIGELSLPMQAKLLQLLESGKFCRIGAHKDLLSEARVICATSRDLKQEIEAGRFREDLFYRINVVNVTLPSLQERRADIPNLVEYFRARFNMVYSRRVPPISASLMRVLQAYPWPGNIRQLENMLKRYVVLGTEACVASDLSDVSPGLSEVEIPEHGPVPLKKVTQQAMRRLERKIILQVLESQHWNRRRTAEVLKISYRALLYKIRDAGLSPGHPGIARRSGIPSHSGISSQSEISGHAEAEPAGPENNTSGAKAA
jgi:two-component system response regulator AtoC